MSEDVFETNKSRCKYCSFLIKLLIRKIEKLMEE